MRDHDRQRLFSMLHLSTSIDLHYLISTALDKNDAVEWYKILKTHIHGRLNKDVRAAKKLLEDLKFLPSKTVRENVSAFEEVITNLNLASDIPFSDTDKLFYLQEKYIADIRPQVTAIMAMAKAQELDYPSTVKSLFLADPPTIATHRVNAITSELELCRRFLAGTCSNGDKCKYSHKSTGF